MTVIMSPWRPLFDGVDGILHAAGMADEAFGLPGVQRDQRVQVVKIDLTTSGLGFFTTPLDPTSKYQTRNATIFDFLAAYPQVKLAINASLAEGDDDGNATLFGLCKSEGNLVCDPTVPAPQPKPTSEPDVRNDADTGTIALTITRDNQASFAIINAQSPTWLPPNSRLIEHSPWPGVFTAIAGSPNSYDWPPKPFVTGALKPGEAMTLRGGVNNGNPHFSGPSPVAGRTAVGLDAAARNLFLMTIDGIEGQPYGANFYDTGEWLKLAGAADGINLDGGGSTAMAVNIGGASLLMNVPHGTEGPPYLQRANAQFFGVTLSG
jgi:hypothetical protein